MLELQEKVQRSRSDHLISRYRVWYWLEKELLPSQITSLQCIKDLAPAKHFITVFIFSSVGQVQSAVSIFGLRESMRGRERERENTQQATERAGGQLGLLATCQHGDFHWPSLAWW